MVATMKSARSDEIKCVQNNAANEIIGCGIGSLRPKWARWMSNIKCFLIWYALANMMSSALGAYMVSQVTTFEKLLGLSSQTTGFLLAANDIGYLIVIIFASHFARNSNKPRVIGCLIIVFGITAVLCAIPHFVMASYPGLFYYTPTSESNGAGGSGQDNQSSITPLCDVHLNRSTSHTIGQESSIKSSIRTMTLGLISSCLIIQGAIKAPRNPLGVTYLDDHVEHSKLGLYIALVFALTLAGISISTSMGAVFTQIYATLEDVPISTADTRFIGAWWLGFIVIGLCALILALPLLCFPKILKSHRQFRKVSNNEITGIEMPTPDILDVVDNSAMKEDSGKKKWPEKRAELFSEIKALWQSIKRLIKNPLYMCFLTANSVGLLGIIGRTSFFPKYLEVHFNLPAHEAIFVFGTTTVVGAVLGSIASGIIMAVFKMTPKTSLIFAITVSFIAMILSYSSVAFSCPQNQFQGFDIKSIIPDARVEQPPLPHIYTGNLSCSVSCNCALTDYLPICGEDGLTYFSPCHAGCSNRNSLNQMYYNCSCVSPLTNQTATSGQCQKQCETTTSFIVVSFMGAVIALLSLQPFVVVKLRSVSDEDRSLAVGLNSFCTTFLGSFLAPIIFGGIIDSCCRFWLGGSCQIYDIDDFRIKLITISTSFSFIADMLYLCALLLVIFNKKCRQTMEWHAMESRKKKNSYTVNTAL